MIDKEFEKLVERRKNWLKADLENGFNTFQIIANLYSEPTHFVYEILQNAEDAGATNVKFCLYFDKLEIFHDGREFTLRDVDSITAIAKSTKSDNVNAVGKFGIGFKSVFAISAQPQIVTRNYIFRIENYIMPQLGSLNGSVEKYLGEYTTKIILPFKNEKYSQTEIYEMLSLKINKLEPETLLFLKNIQCIKVSNQVQDKVSVEYDEKLYHKEKTKCIGSQEICISNSNKHQKYEDEENIILYAGNSSEKWKVFRNVISDSSNREYCIEIAYKIDTDSSGNENVQYLKSAKMAVMFMTEKITNLGFVIQGPFKTTPARDNVPPDDPWNQFVMQKIGDLTVMSMIRMRDLGKLDRNFLSVMPVNSEYFIGRSIKEAIALPVFEAVKTALSKESLIPTQTTVNPYVNVKQALLPNTAKLSRLVSNEQLNDLIQKNMFWVDPEITENKAQTRELYYYFRDQLKIEIYTDEKFAKNFETDRFIKKQTDEWIIQFYNYLADNITTYFKKPYVNYYCSVQKITPGPFFNARIAKLTDNSFVRFFKDNIDATPQVSLPGEFENVSNTIKRVFASNQDAIRLFTGLELKEFVLFDEVMQNVLPRYINCKAINDRNIDYSDHKKIAKMLSTGTSTQVAMLLDKIKTTKLFYGQLLSDESSVIASTLQYGIIVKNSLLNRVDGDRIDTIRRLTNTKVVILDSSYSKIYTIEQFKQMGILYKPSDTEITLKIILPNYLVSAKCVLDKDAVKKNTSDILFIINTLKILQNSVEELNTIKSAPIIITDTGKNLVQWSSLKETYARTPDLIEYFKGNTAIHFLSEHYKKFDSDAYKAIEQACNKFPKLICSEFPNSKYYQKGFTYDCVIEGMRECFEKSVSKSSSIFIWNYLVSIVDKLLFSGVIERANDRAFKGSGYVSETIDSQFYQIAKQAKWLYTNENKRYHPSQISIDSFCDGYDVRSSKAKLLISQLNIQATSVRSEAISHLSSIEQKAIEMVAMYGVDAFTEWEALMKKRKEAENKKFEKKDYLNSFAQVVSQEKIQSSACEITGNNEWSNGLDNSQAELIRRKAENNLEKMEDIQEKVVERKVVDRSSAESEEAKNFLNAEYDGQCQLCGVKIPTQKGTNYFNTYRFIKPKEGKAYSNHYSNVLCLCPNCFVRIGAGPQPNDIKNILNYAGKLIHNDLLEQEVPEFKKDMYVVPILLSGTKKNIHFTKRHFNNLAVVYKELAAEKINEKV